MNLNRVAVATSLMIPLSMMRAPWVPPGNVVGPFVSGDVAGPFVSGDVAGWVIYLLTMPNIVARVGVTTRNVVSWADSRAGRSFRIKNTSGYYDSERPRGRVEYREEY